MTFYTIGVFEIVVPDLINNIAKKFCNAMFGRFITGIVIEAGFMGRLCTNLDNCRDDGRCFYRRGGGGRDV